MKCLSSGLIGAFPKTVGVLAQIRMKIKSADSRIELAWRFRPRASMDTRRPPTWTSLTLGPRRGATPSNRQIGAKKESFLGSNEAGMLLKTMMLWWMIPVSYTKQSLTAHDVRLLVSH